MTMHDASARRGVAVIGLVMIAGALLAACDRPQAKNEAKGSAAPAVTVSRPLIEPIIDWDEYTGRFDAIDTVDVRTRVSGHLDVVAFKDGQIVQKGDLLYVLDPRSFERALEQAKAELAQVQTKADNLVADVERGKPLLERRIMSEKTFEDRSNLLKEALAAVKVSQAKTATAELELSFTRITAPIAGRISRSSRQSGQLGFGRRQPATRRCSPRSSARIRFTSTSM